MGCHVPPEASAGRFLAEVAPVLSLASGLGPVEGRVLSSLTRRDQWARARPGP